MENYLLILEWTTIVTLVAAFIDIYRIVVEKKHISISEKPIRALIRVAFIAIPILLFNRNWYLVGACFMLYWTIFDTTLGLACNRDPFYLGKNSVLDKVGKIIGGRIYFVLKVVMFIGFIVLLLKS